MGKLLEIGFTGIITIGELIVMLVLLALIRKIIYKIWRIDFYKEIWKKLNELDKKLNKYFNKK